MIEKRHKQRKYFAPQNDGTPHRCDFPGCDKEGLYRAPKDKTLKEYYWFCLEHVSAYNAKWNWDTSDDDSHQYFQGRKMRFSGFSSKIKYQFGYDFLDELGDLGYFDEKSYREKLYFTAKDREHAAVLNLSLDNCNRESIKKQYKKLARKYHPDVNAGDKVCEEKFKKITVAYNELMKKFK